jgi:hypothetical protein
MFLKFLSPVSILVGIVVAVAVLIYLSPLDGHGAPVALLAFCVGAGACELIRRIVRPQSVPAAQTTKDKE